MALQGEKIEPWMMDEVKKFIEGEFLEATVDYFPRGNGSAVLFRIEGRPSHTEPRKLLHQIWLDKTFLVRCMDRTSLINALEGADIIMSMKKAGDKIVELH
jgi:hypothetical protein